MNFHIFSTAIYEISSVGNKLEIKSSLLKHKEKTLEFKDIVRRACSSNETCFALLNDGSIFSYDFIDMILKDISLQTQDDKVTDICCTHSSLICVTSNNCLYQLSSRVQRKIHDFPKHQKPKKIVAGAEHCVILSTNGDVYSFGSGFRGALGYDYCSLLFSF